MSRFASPDPTARLDLGPCQCDGSPHESDWVIHRTKFGYGPLGEITIVAQTDIMAAKRKTLVLGIIEWNFLDDGETAPIDDATIADLDPMTAETIYQAIDRIVFTSEPLPNASGARSRGSSRASASRRHGRTPKPTTPSLSSVPAGQKAS